MKRERIDMMRDDLKHIIEENGDIVTFIWIEKTGGVWNDTYEVWEGGSDEEKTYKLRGIGKVVDYKEDELEYEYGRIGVGECIVRFGWDDDLSPIKNKSGLRFLYKGQKWQIDSPIGVGDSLRDEMYSLILKGVKSTS